jgi:hypothetical protein
MAGRVETIGRSAMMREKNQEEGDTFSVRSSEMASDIHSDEK